MNFQLKTSYSCPFPVEDNNFVIVEKVIEIVINASGLMIFSDN